MKHLVQYSTGAASAEVAYRVVQEHGPENVVLLSADTLVEDPDNWRFADEAARLLACEWIILADGRTPMQAGRDRKVVPSDRLDICSQLLKRRVLWDFMQRNYDPAASVIYIGYDWTEPHRYKAAQPNWAPWTVRAPLMDPPYMWKPDILAAWRERGIPPPRLYDRGLGHANCGGFCVRGGIADWNKGLQADRPGYLVWEAEEEKTRCMLGKDVAILRDRHGGTTTPLTLRAHRERRDSVPTLFDPEYGPEDYGACGCFGADEKPLPMGTGKRESHRLTLVRGTTGTEVRCSCRPGAILAASAAWRPGEYIAAWHDFHPRDTDGRYLWPVFTGTAPSEVA